MWSDNSAINLGDIIERRNSFLSLNKFVREDIIKKLGIWEKQLNE